MHGGIGRVVAVVLALVTAAACGGAPSSSTALPTFVAPTSPAGGPPVAGPDQGAVPDRCEELLTVADLGALLGLPLDSVTLRTTLHVAQPGVGRTERVACRYTGTGPVSGTLLDIDVSAYSDPDAAAEQWRVNAAAEDGDRRTLPIGSASAVLVERPREAVLRVVHGASNITFLLPARRLPDNRSEADVLVDLALRLLAAVGPADAPVPPPTAPVRAAGTQS